MMNLDNSTASTDGDSLPTDSHSSVANLDQFKRQTLSDNNGVLFRTFKSTLRPRLHQVWGELLAGHVVLFAILALLIFIQARYPPALTVPMVAVSALLIGYTLAYIQLFFHEAAHYNIASGRAINDTLANIFIGVFVGQDIAQYRIVHFDHHRFLGTTRDTERSYFDPLSVRFILESLTGIRVLKVVAVRQGASVTPRSPAAAENRGMFNRHLLVGMLAHGVLLGGALWFGQWAVATAWLLGVAVFFPFFGAVRQVLEHRSESAGSNLNYAEVDHGAVNRIFGDGVLASTLGGAGFNRHLLHHWEPQISYTRLRELERYLLNTPAAEAVRVRKTTYQATFRALLRAH